MSILRLLPYSILAVLASCQSMSQGVLAIEARALVLDDAELDDIESGSAFDQQDVDLSGYGVQAALMTPIFDLLAAYDEREFGDETTPQISLGLRRRIFEIWRVHPFIEGNFRYGTDLENGVSSNDYTGWDLGIGAMVDLTDHLFVNVRLMYEKTPVDLPSSESDVEGVIGTIGLGWAF